MGTKAEYTKYYYRDYDKLSHEEWLSSLSADLEEEYKTGTQEIIYTTLTQVVNGGDVELNGHLYTSTTVCVYKTAKDLLTDMIEDCYYTEVLDALKSLTEEEAKMIIKYIERVKKKNNKFILEVE